MPAALTAINLLADTTFYVLMKDRSILAIAGALSMSQEDVENYDGSTHSQLVDASVTGNPHNMPMVLKGLESDGGSSIPAGATHITVTNLATRAADTLAPGYYPDTAGVKPGGTIDESFDFNFTPGNTKKTDTLFKWYSGALVTGAPSGSLVAFARLSQIRCMGPALPTLLN